MMLTLADRLRKEGKKETTREIIKNAFDLGLPINIIEKLTGISAEKINRMKEKMAQS